MRLLTSRRPSNWRDLQAQVATILEECGFKVEPEKTIRSVRGTVELDVYGEEVIKGRRYAIACECKLWKARVSQTVIHAFRTVVGDIGANVGYLISSRGFQSGSFKASELTNIQLVTWEQFQDAFCETWLEKYFRPIITEQLDKIMTYTEPLVPRWMIEVPDHEVPHIRGLRDKYVYFGVLAMSLSTYAAFLNDKVPELPLREHTRGELAKDENIPSRVLDANGYRDLLYEMLSYGKAAIEEFELVRKRNNL